MSPVPSFSNSESPVSHLLGCITEPGNVLFLVLTCSRRRLLAIQSHLSGLSEEKSALNCRLCDTELRNKPPQKNACMRNLDLKGLDCSSTVHWVTTAPKSGMGRRFPLGDQHCGLREIDNVLRPGLAAQVRNFPFRPALRDLLLAHLQGQCPGHRNHTHRVMALSVRRSS
jgi:hypothetical protein